MMQPFDLNEIKYSLPNVPQYHDIVKYMKICSKIENGVAYITIDEVSLQKGEIHRRPGLHVDGLGAWGGGGSWAANGMILGASAEGCKVWKQNFEGFPDEEGSCEHLKDQLNKGIVMKSNTLYWCEPLTVHESIPVSENVKRQFIRLSMPNKYPWFEGYTPSPVGIKPTGPILPKREIQMGYRAYVG